MISAVMVGWKPTLQQNLAVLWWVACPPYNPSLRLGGGLETHPTFLPLSPFQMRFEWR